MKKYVVDFNVTQSCQAVVEAENRQQAIEIVEEGIDPDFIEVFSESYSEITAEEKED